MAHSSAKNEGSTPIEPKGRLIRILGRGFEIKAPGKRKAYYLVEREGKISNTETWEPGSDLCAFELAAFEFLLKDQRDAKIAKEQKNGCPILRGLLTTPAPTEQTIPQPEVAGPSQKANNNLNLSDIELIDLTVSDGEDANVEPEKEMSECQTAKEKKMPERKKTKEKKMPECQKTKEKQMSEAEMKEMDKATKMYPSEPDVVPVPEWSSTIQQGLWPVAVPGGNNLEDDLDNIGHQIAKDCDELLKGGFLVE